MKSIVPVTIITGFLGSGKTTLLKYIMAANHGYRIAVIQNEFSDEMGIESPTLVDANGQIVDDIYELPNGCICCSVRGEMVAAIDTLLDKYPGKFDYILVETSGITDPEPIAASFWMDDALDSNVTLDGIVCLVDAKNFEAAVGLVDLSEADDLDQKLLKTLADENQTKHQSEGLGESAFAGGLLGLAREAVKQVAASDRILLNKVDLLKDQPEKLSRVRKILKALNPLADIIDTSNSAIPDLSSVLNLKAFDPKSMISRLSVVQTSTFDQKSSISIKNLNNCSSEHCCESSDHCGSAAHDESPHQHCHKKDCHSCDATHGGVSNCIVTVNLKLQETAIDAELLEPLLGDLIWGRECGIIYRCKGLFYGLLFNDDDEGRMWKEPHVCALQGVGESFEIVKVKAVSVNDLEHVDGNFQAKFLFVGVGLNQKRLSEGIASVLAKVPLGGADAQIPKRHRFDDEEQS
eukprot:GDKJ01061518.1.p1 GENE.GDKJ01061518.1~~GDKJ01061518.1.p1  ORF type:complete len:464 (-),score=92.91 GDKJ01061518.1:21-1412(-)